MKLLSFFIMLACSTIFNILSAQDSVSISLSDSVKQYIIRETTGGKLDFAKAMENEKKQLFLIKGVAYNRKDAAIYLWGASVKKLGISSVEHAIDLYQSIINKNLTVPETNALRNGFNRDVTK